MLQWHNGSSIADDHHDNNEVKEPVVVGQRLTWSLGQVSPEQTYVIHFATRVSASAALGVITNIAQAFSDGKVVSAQAQSTVMVVEPKPVPAPKPEPAVPMIAQTPAIVVVPIKQCIDVKGVVFDDHNRNGVKDEDEFGFAGVAVHSVENLKRLTDENGKYLFSCSDIPAAYQDSDIPLQVDVATLPVSYEMTTAVKLIAPANRSNDSSFDFGAAKKPEPPVVELRRSTVMQGGDFEVVVVISGKVSDELKKELAELVFYYDLDKAKVREAAEKYKRLAQLLAQEKNLTIHLDGHTDRSASEAYNLKLAARRTASVKKYLTQSAQIVKEDRAPIPCQIAPNIHALPKM